MSDESSRSRNGVLERAAQLIRDAQPLAEPAERNPDWLKWCLDARAWLHGFDKGDFTASEKQPSARVWNLVDRAYKIMEQAGYRVAEHNPDHNNPIIAWMADARLELNAAPQVPPGVCPADDPNPEARRDPAGSTDAHKAPAPAAVASSERGDAVSVSDDRHGTGTPAVAASSGHDKNSLPFDGIARALREYASARQEASGKWDSRSQRLIDWALALESSPSATRTITVTDAMIEAGKRAIDAYYDGTKDAPFEGSVKACFLAMLAEADRTESPKG
jgi:hypothetical protein